VHLVGAGAEHTLSLPEMRRLDALPVAAARKI